MKRLNRECTRMDANKIFDRMDRIFRIGIYHEAAVFAIKCFLGIFWESIFVDLGLWR